MMLVLGSSHHFALAFGCPDHLRPYYNFKNLGEIASGSVILRPFDSEADSYDFAPELRDWLQTTFNAERLLLSIRGSDWLDYCLSNRREKFDFMLPSHPDLPEIADARRIPYAEMRRHMSFHCGNTFKGIAHVRALVNVPMAYIEPPPPIGDNAQIENTNPYEKERFDEFGVTDPILRRKCYLLHGELLDEACRKNGVALIRVPPALMTPDGFLPPDAYDKDWVHANNAWGGAMMEHVHQTWGAYQ